MVYAMTLRKSENERSIHGDFTFQVVCCQINNKITNINRGEKKLIPKVKNYAQNVVAILNDSDFKSHFRLNRSSFEVLFKEIIIEYDLSEDNIVGEKSKIVENHILLSIWYMANLETYRQLGDRFEVSKSNAHGIVRKFISIMEVHKHKFIKWPRGNAINQTIQDFKHLRPKPFPGAFMALDGCHIKVPAPWNKRRRMRHIDQRCYINRKHVASVVLQGICDSKQKFTNIFAGWPGASHDARIFRKSSIGVALNDPLQNLVPENCYILADSTYPLSQNVMVPYRDNGALTAEQHNFNRILSSSRVVIELTFGKLLGRFRRFKYLEVYNKDFCGAFISAACCLHNICMDQNDQIDCTDYTSQNQESNFNISEINVTATHKRNAICNELSINT
ncbi:putative nuclease HARBI1 isoform X4 [Rhopalosiphum padi]|uniref:putative nuclease HARBI1 isoform X4 n=1 Tax=Rhopalosiphum padi TaxID=40932 RepID=UPI00298E1890|nr:putative nuclease HARBI1 isoform X4 [Rhopalosiphum padi]